MSENGEIYTAGKNFTLPPAVTGWTNSTSDLFLRRQKRVMLYKTPLLTVQCAAKGPLRDVSLLLSTVYSFHGHGIFPWRRNFFRKQHKHFFTEQFPH